MLPHKIKQNWHEPRSRRRCSPVIMCSLLPLLCLLPAAQAKEEPVIPIAVPDGFTTWEVPRELPPIPQEDENIQKLLDAESPKTDTLRQLAALGYRIIDSWSYEATLLRAIGETPAEQEIVILRLPYYLCPEQNKYAFLTFDQQTQSLAAYHITLLSSPLPFHPAPYPVPRLSPLWTKDVRLLNMVGQSWASAMPELEKLGYKYCRNPDIIEAARQLTQQHKNDFEVIIPPSILYGIRTYIIVLLNDDGTFNHHEVVAVERDS